MSKLYVVATPIGNLHDISQRANSILAEVNWIAAEDTRHSQILLQHLGISKPLISYHEHNEKQRTPQLIQKLKAGECGALISDAGTPLISDPGFSLVVKALDEGIRVIPIPGPCALITALSVAGLATDKFLFEGFLPAKQQTRHKRLQELANFKHTMIFYEAPHRLAMMLRSCLEILGSQRPATLVRELTKKFESVYKSTLGDLLNNLQMEKIPEKGEFILIVSGHLDQGSLDEEERAMLHILSVLLEEVSLKQAVQITAKITGVAKNKVYDLATKLKSLGK